MTNKEAVFSLIKSRKYLENCDDDNLVFNAEPFDKAVQALNILEDIKKGLSKVLFTKEVSDIGLANEDMNKGAIIAYQDIYNRIVELEHDDYEE